MDILLWKRQIFFLFFFILLIHEGSHREVYQEFQPSYDIFRRWCQGLLRPQVPCTPSLHCPIANSATWKELFRAYYDAAHLGSLSYSQQQAYLNCLDVGLVDREATGTTPVYSPVHGLITCISILDSTFLESNPIHLLRKQFFDARQRDGQSVIEFRAGLLSFMEEADGANIGLNDLICMMCQIGVSGPALQHELGDIKTPTLSTFSEKLEGYEQACTQSAFGLAATRGAPPCQAPSSGQARNTSRSNPACGRGERDRRLALHGKCFHCASDNHMLPQRTYPDSIMCNTCSATGHISPPTWGRRQKVSFFTSCSYSTARHCLRWWFFFFHVYLSR